MKVVLLVVGLVALSCVMGGPFYWGDGPVGLAGGLLGMVLGLIGSVFGAMVGLAGGIFGAAIGLAAGVFGAAVGVAAGVFGAVVGLATVAAVFGLPLLIVAVVIYGLVKAVGA